MVGDNNLKGNNNDGGGGGPGFPCLFFGFLGGGAGTVTPQ